MTHIQDDGFHEIQLNGKQLVFLFMAATVVSVVIFLLGVLVGRGVGSERTVADAAIIDELPPPDLPPPGTTGVLAAPAGGDPTKAAAPSPADDLNYFNRLEHREPVTENLKPSSAATEPAPPGRAPAAATPPQPTAPAAMPRGTAAAAAPELSPAVAPAAAGRGFVVQIAALNARSEADALVKQWTSKGYQAFVQGPASGTPNIYRVRIGPFKTKREAELTASKLRQEERLNPWVTQP